MTNRKSHTPLRLVPKWTTLDGRYAFCCRKMRLSEPTSKIEIKIYPYYQQQKCRPMSIRFMRIFAGIPCRGGVKRQWDCRERQFSAFSTAVYSETLEMRPALLYGDTQAVVSFSVIPKCMTLNGYFEFNSVFAQVWLTLTVRHLKNNFVQINMRGVWVRSLRQTFKWLPSVADTSLSLSLSRTF